MITYTYFKEHIVGKYCRNCINEKTKGHLYPRDCIYAYYPSECMGCGEMDKNIIIDVRFKNRYKLLRMHKPRK